MERTEYKSKELARLARGALELSARWRGIRARIRLESWTLQVAKAGVQIAAKGSYVRPDRSRGTLEGTVLL